MKVPILLIRSVLLPLSFALANAHGVWAQTDYAAPVMAGISSHGRGKDQPYVTAGDRTYLIGTQDGNFPDMGSHVAGEMGGLWLQLQLAVKTDLSPVWYSNRLGIKDAQDTVAWDATEGVFIANDAANTWFAVWGATGSPEAQPVAHPEPIQTKGMGVTAACRY